MYDFHSNIMKPKYGNDMELLMTDTDSFVYKIKTDDFYKEMYDMRECFDLSDYKEFEDKDGEMKKYSNPANQGWRNSSCKSFRRRLILVLNLSEYE